MKNPLRKRILRSLVSDAGKYIVIFLLLAMSIGFTSGFLVAVSSLMTAYDESFDKYNVEDGHFTAKEELTDAQLAKAEKGGVSIYENYYVERDFSNDTTLRIFANRDEINKACVMDGRLPESKGEIAIDRMYADNNGLLVGDVLESDEESYSIVGLVALSDYSALFYSNNDMMFDASAFGVAVVSRDMFEEYNSNLVYYEYAWLYDEEPADEAREKELSDDFMERLSDITELEDYIPGYLNQSIKFTGNDFGSDKAMMQVLLYIMIAILAFVFGINMVNTIRKESSVIGTLRAMGYTVGELIRHYMALPVIVTVIAAIVGNILGYTSFKNICVDLEYASYSLPSYVTIWNAEAFIMTTCIPLIIMVVITFVMLRRALRISPLRLMRNDLTQNKRINAIRLNSKIKFLKRFRLRIFLQSKTSYVTLFLGVFFANILLTFGMMLPPLLTHYQECVMDTMLADYTTFITMPPGTINEDNELAALFMYNVIQDNIASDNPDAEKFSAVSLKTTGDDGARIEDVVIYGISEDSRYIDADFGEDTVLISSAYADKFRVGEGDVITLKEPYEEKYYGFRVTGTYDYDGAVCVFMDREALNEAFGYDDDFFTGYFSSTEITDIDEKYKGTVIDKEALTRVSRQMKISMGDMMNMVDVFAIVLVMAIIYLLSKFTIERNTLSISMLKILGYKSGEISGIYLIPTAVAFIISLLISYPILSFLLVKIYRAMLKRMMSGWLILWLDPKVYVEMFVMCTAVYIIVAVIEYFRIGRIPKAQALKNAE